MVAVSGLGSGLDIDGLVTGLVNAERVPQQNRLLNREQTATNLISAFGQLKGVLSSLQSKLAPLQNPDTFTQISSSSTQSAAVSVSSDSTAATGSYQVSVQGLATTQSFASGTFAAADTVVGTGTLTLAFGTPTFSGGDPDTYTSFDADPERTPIEITIDSSNNTLEGVRDAINEADAGVSASLVKDGDQYRLLLSTDETGVSNSLAVSVTGDGDGNNADNAGLSALAFDATTANLTQTRAANDAQFTINGLALTSPTDTVTDVLDGVTLTLKKITETDATISVSENRSAITSAVGEFVEIYNEYISTSDNLTSYDAASQVRGPLQGDFSARSIRSQLRNELTSPAGFDTGTFNALAQIGISTDRDGRLTFNAGSLNEALDTDPQSVIAIFADTEVNGTERLGLASRLDSVLEGIVGSRGLLDSRTDGLNDTIARISADREVLNERMEALEARFRIQFNALDALLANITTTGDFLQQQLDNLPGYSSGKD
ncbi:MAG: flagellar filament capping protein FliD [Halieaceae bacterium]|jgi:flagellar hook-associated protein 2|nr:flagellar filament capping protein FliD [Halieaceae bacterium]